VREAIDGAEAIPCSSNDGTYWQLPVAHDPTAHAVSQHTLVTQNVELHSEPAPHAWPSARAGTPLNVTLKVSYEATPLAV
jgi:hypothetical protein